jgi:hypothetical protein
MKKGAAIQIGRMNRYLSRRHRIRTQEHEMNTVKKKE